MQILLTDIINSEDISFFFFFLRPAPTYETGTTRVYWHGRTETIRSCTMEALQWIKAMADPLLSVSPNHIFVSLISPQERQ